MGLGLDSAEKWNLLAVDSKLTTIFFSYAFVFVSFLFDYVQPKIIKLLTLWSSCISFPSNESQKFTQNPVRFCHRPCLQIKFLVRGKDNVLISCHSIHSVVGLIATGASGDKLNQTITFLNLKKKEELVLMYSHIVGTCWVNLKSALNGVGNLYII